MITEPKIEDRNEQHYVGIRTQVTVQEMGPVLPPLWGEVYGWLASKGLKPAGAPLWRYRVVDMEAKMEIDVGVPLATTVTGDGRVTADAGRYATLIYTGPYDGLMRATADLLAWAKEKAIVWDKWPVGLQARAGGPVSRTTSLTRKRSRIQRNGKQNWPLNWRIPKPSSCTTGETEPK
jgi:effector-binding domain-containing protein